MATKTKTKRAQTASAPDEVIERYILNAPEQRQKALGRHYRNIQAAKATIDSIDTLALQAIVKGIGASDAAVLFGTTLEQVRERLSVLRAESPVQAAKAFVKRSIETVRVQTPSGPRDVATDDAIINAAKSASSRPATQLVDDAKSAVPLATLVPGQAFKTPDSPTEGLAGTHGVLLYANECRARVRLQRAPRVVTLKNSANEATEVEFKQSGEIDWAANTAVIPLADL